MRLTESQKAAALTARPGATLVRVGDRWGVLWKDQTAPLHVRWRAQLVYSVENYADPDDLAIKQKVWWEGAEIAAATRRAVVQVLHLEASS